MDRIFHSSKSFGSKFAIISAVYEENLIKENISQKIIKNAEELIMWMRFYFIHET